jgi:hypothetical protein
MPSTARRTLGVTPIALSLVALAAYAQAPDGPTRLTTEFRGPGLCLDVVNGGPRNNFVELRPCGNFTGQMWHSNP